MEENSDQIDFSKMKKKKKSRPIKKESPIDNHYKQYEEMLENIFVDLRNLRGGSTKVEGQKFVIKQPEIARIGSRKTGWMNFQEICDMIKRPADHISRFFLVELGAEGSLAQNVLIFKGRFNEHQIEFILKKYITEYVLCQMCRSMQTVLIRDPSIRTFTMTCEKCESTRSVQTIKEGYHHVSKADRKKAKMAA